MSNGHQKGGKMKAKILFFAVVLLTMVSDAVKADAQSKCSKTQFQPLINAAKTNNANKIMPFVASDGITLFYVDLGPEKYSRKEFLKALQSKEDNDLNYLLFTVLAQGKLEEEIDEAQDEKGRKKCTCWVSTEKSSGTYELTFIGKKWYLTTLGSW